MELIKGAIKKYDWGVQGLGSQVAQLGSMGKHITEIVKPNDYFAELWLGTHPSGSASLLSTGISLKNARKGNLPYLLKVLSVSKALSIQIHPDKLLASKLHQSKPEMYPDANHKPEIAVCVGSRFEALCGLRSNAKDLIELHYPWLRPVKTIKELLLPQNKTCVFDTLYNVIKRKHNNNTKSPLDKIILKLYQEHGEDVCVLAPIFMNHIVLGYGDALAVFPGTPHAYLSGDFIVECMACSDNVIRLGLTTKQIDLETVSTMDLSDVYQVIRTGQSNSSGIKEYCVFDEFRLRLLDNIKDLDVCRFGKDSIMLVLCGTAIVQGEQVQKGSAVFFPKETEIKFYCVNNLQVVIADPGV